MSLITVTVDALLKEDSNCKNCLDRLMGQLGSLKGIQQVEFDNEKQAVDIQYNPDLVTISRIEEQAQQIGATISKTIKHRTILLKELDCPDCARSIDKTVNKINGVIWAGTNFASTQMHVEFDESIVGLDLVCNAVSGHGVIACPIDNSRNSNDSVVQESGNPLSLFTNKRFSTIACAVQTGMAYLFHANATIVSILCTTAVLTGGLSIARSAFAALRSRSLDMNVLMTLAVIGALSMQDWLEAATVVSLFTIGNMLQIGAMERTRDSVKKLLELSPKTAFVERNAVPVEVDIAKVSLGEIVLVKPGERFSLDGVITEGTSYLNESPITGESTPVSKTVGDKVFAGALNGASAIKFQVTSIAENSTLARMVHRIEEAQAQRAPTQQLIDRFASIYTPLVVALAAVVSILPPVFAMLIHNAPNWQSWITRGLSLLIIACPCALVISTPVAIVTAIGTASKRGALIKGGAYLEAIGKVRTIFFDKTGTLTAGKMSVNSLSVYQAVSEDEVLYIAYSLEQFSQHPVSRSIVTYVEKLCDSGQLQPLAVREFVDVPGFGVTGEIDGQRYQLGNSKLMQREFSDAEALMARLPKLPDFEGSTIYLSNSNNIIAAFHVDSDPIRPMSRDALSKLHKLGISRMAVLTGDSNGPSKKAALELNISECHSELLPDEKQVFVAESVNSGTITAMVGDGINDALSLATSNVGIAMGVAGSDVAVETADIALLGDDLDALPFLVRLGQRTRKIITQNIWFSLSTKAALIVAALFVGIPLWIAVFGDVGVSMLVTLNALRLRKC